MSYSFKAVYRGNGTGYTDSFSETEDGERYIYRLDKRRGKGVHRLRLRPGRLVHGC